MLIAEQTLIVRESLFTFGGASAAVWLLMNTFRRLTKFTSPWWTFCFCLLIAYTSAFMLQQLGGLGDVVVALLNSCLLFCTALGINETFVNISDTGPEPGRIRRHGGRSVGWLESWWSK